MLLFVITGTNHSVWADESIDHQKKIYDEAELFPEDEEKALEKSAEEIEEKYQMDCIILTLKDTGGKSTQSYAEDFYDENGFGVGDQHDGVIMVVNMGNRSKEMITTGKAIPIFTDYYIEAIWEDVTPYLSEGKMYEGTQEWIRQVGYYNEEFLKYQDNPEETVSEYQNEVNQTKEQEGRKQMVLIAFVMACLISGISIVVLIRKNENVHPFTDGRAYVKQNAFLIKQQQDRFVSTHTSRTPIPKNDSSDSSWGGGSSTHSGSSGTTHGGGGGGF